MRRGFKIEAERIAQEIRGELGLRPSDRLNPYLLAEHLGIPIYAMKDLCAGVGNSSFTFYFSVVDPETFSAITVFIGLRRMIVHNESHHPNRQSSDIAHEIAHALLEHQPAQLLDGVGQRFWNAEMEDEAGWLGAALLVPRAGALGMARSGKPSEEIAEHYGVSGSLCQWRVRQTGVLKQVERSRSSW